MTRRKFTASLSEGDFRDAMAHMASSVCVASVAAAGVRAGRTVTAVFPLSIAPPRIIVSIDSACDFAKTVRAAKRFSLSLLSPAQHEIADAFAGRVPPAGRFKGGDWGQWPSGQHRLAEAVIGMDCALSHDIVMGDHVLFVGDVAAVETGTYCEPLLWHRRKYRRMD